MIQNDDLRARLAPLAHAVETIVPEAEMLKKLERGPPLRCKFGIDPTSTTVHIGNGLFMSNDGYEFGLALLAAAVALAISGGGRASVDAVLAARR